MVYIDILAFVECVLQYAVSVSDANCREDENNVRSQQERTATLSHHSVGLIACYDCYHIFLQMNLLLKLPIHNINLDEFASFIDK